MPFAVSLVSIRVKPMQIFITRGEDSSGPYTPEQVQDYLAQGGSVAG